MDGIPQLLYKLSSITEDFMSMDFEKEALIYLEDIFKQKRSSYSSWWLQECM